MVLKYKNGIIRNAKFKKLFKNYSKMLTVFTLWMNYFFNYRILIWYHFIMVNYTKSSLLVYMPPSIIKLKKKTSFTNDECLKKVLFSFLNNRATKIGLFHFYLTVYKNNSLKFSNYSKFNNDKSKIKAICYLLVEVNYIFYIYEVFVL